jgi:hypothetical protein
MQGAGNRRYQTAEITLSLNAGERTRLACRRWRHAIANFSVVQSIQYVATGCFGESPKPARESRALPGEARSGEEGSKVVKAISARRRVLPQDMGKACRLLVPFVAVFEPYRRCR